MFKRAAIGDFVHGKLVSFRLTSTYYRDEEHARRQYGKRFIKLVDSPEMLDDDEIENAEAEMSLFIR